MTEFREYMVRHFVDLVGVVFHDGSKKPLELLLNLGDELL